MSDLRIKAMDYALAAMKGAPFTEIRAAAESFEGFLRGYTLQDAGLLKQAQNLAECLHKKHYSDVTQWRVADDLEGVISQIDNMTAGLFRTLNVTTTGDGSHPMTLSTPPPLPHQDFGKSDQSPAPMWMTQDDVRLGKAWVGDDFENAKTRIVRPQEAQ
jgi:hypothetical protein